MKKQLIILMLVVFTGAGQLSAQDNSMDNLPTVTVTSGTVVNTEVTKAFKKAFPKAQNTKWYEQHKKYIVKFIENDMRHQALYTKKGSMRYVISFGKENNLSVDMVKKIHSAYSEYIITNVANVKEAGRDIWVVNLENQKHLLLVRLENDELEEVEKFNKN